MKKNRHWTSWLVGLALLAPVVLGAQGAGKTAAVSADVDAMKQELKVLNAKERSELHAVDGSSATPEQKKTDRQRIRLNYRRQRQALRRKYLGDVPEETNVRRDQRPLKPLTVKESKSK